MGGSHSGGEPADSKKDSKKFTAQEIDELFEDRYFIWRLRQRWLALGLSFLGIGGLGAVALFQQFSDLRSQIKSTQDQINSAKDETRKIKTANDQLRADLTKDLNDARNAAMLSAANARDSAETARGETDRIRQQYNDVRSSAQLANAAIGTATQSLGSMGRDLTTRAGELNALAGRLNREAALIRESQEKIVGKLPDIEKAAKASPRIQEALTGADELRTRTTQLSSFKTFEIVTLRSRETKAVNLTLRTVRQGPGAKLIDDKYEMAFTTAGLSSPVKLRVEVRSGERKWTVNYPQIEFKKNEPHPTHCVTGTPFMFQADNYVQSPFVRDFLTLKVVGRDSTCRNPEGALEGDVPPDPIPVIAKQ